MVVSTQGTQAPQPSDVSADSEFRTQASDNLAIRSSILTSNRYDADTHPVEPREDLQMEPAVSEAISVPPIYAAWLFLILPRLFSILGGLGLSMTIVGFTNSFDPIVWQLGVLITIGGFGLSLVAGMVNVHKLPASTPLVLSEAALTRVWESLDVASSSTRDVVRLARGGTEA